MKMSVVSMKMSSQWLLLTLAKARPLAARRECYNNEAIGKNSFSFPNRNSFYRNVG